MLCKFLLLKQLPDVTKILKIKNLDSLSRGYQPVLLLYYLCKEDKVIQQVKVYFG